MNAAAYRETVRVYLVRTLSLCVCRNHPCTPWLRYARYLGGRRLESWSFAPLPEEAPAQILNPRHVHCIGFTPDGAALVVAMGDGSIEVIDALSGWLARNIFSGPEPF